MLCVSCSFGYVSWDQALKRSADLQTRPTHAQSAHALRPRTIHLSLESDLKESKNQNKAQMESNKSLICEFLAGGQTRLGLVEHPRPGWTGVIH